MKIETICVVGLGYVGLPTAALLARAGYRVHGADVSAAVIDALSSGRCPLAENDVAAIVDQALKSGNLTVGLAPVRADAYIICVPTPVLPDRSADLSMVRAAARACAAVIERGALVILESTSPIGTTRDVVGGELAAHGWDVNADLDICYCPERVFPGATVREILQNDRLVGGLTSRAAARAKALYESFCEGSALTADAEVAEFSKLMENTYRDVNIALANVFARIGEDLGVDVHDVIALANRHPRVNVLRPGPGVGGHCIPVDPWFLINAAPGPSDLLRVARDVNDGQAARLLDRAEAAGLARGDDVAILGAAYRGNLDDPRESPSLAMLHNLNERGYRWRIHDPFVRRLAMETGETVEVRPAIADALEGADAAIVMTDHAEYRTLAPAVFAPMAGKLIIDGHRILSERALVEAGYQVLPIGAAKRA